MNIRVEFDRYFSHNIVVYPTRLANVRSLEMASKYRYLILILGPPKILTVYKVDKLDLFDNIYIFSITKGVDFYSVFPEIAIKDGFQILLLDYKRESTKLRLL
ncbi:MAG: hypothetical protein ACTSVV_08280 [Promethearchaeota archaeon]